MNIRRKKFLVAAVIAVFGISFLTYKFVRNSKAQERMLTTVESGDILAFHAQMDTNPDLAKLLFSENPFGVYLAIKSNNEQMVLAILKLTDPKSLNYKIYGKPLISYAADKSPSILNAVLSGLGNLSAIDLQGAIEVAAAKKSCENLKALSEYGIKLNIASRAPASNKCITSF